MASQELDMYGPFEYNQANIDQLVPQNMCGNYASGHLDGNTFYVEYVGRSDNDLHGRISHSLGEYSHFMFSIADSPLEAYYKECRNWHDFGGESNRLDNSIHPAKPKDIKFAFCPICVKRISDKINNHK